MSTKIVTASLLLAAIAQAQTAPCLAFNDQNTNVSNAITATPFVGLNPSSRAYQFTTASTLAVQSAAIFSGSPLRDDYMRLEIWDEDPTTGLPGNRMSVGTMFSPMAMNAHWLGTNLDAVAILNPGTNYWFVWIEAGSSIVPEEPSGTNLPRTTRATTNPWGAIGAGAVKFRLFCNQLDGANVTPYGPPTLTSIGQVPGAFSNDDPVNGTSIGFEATNLPAGAMAWMIVGIDPNYTSTPLGQFFPPGFTVNTDAVIALGATTGTNEIGDQPSSPRPVPFGYVRFSIPLPAGSGGAFLAGQVLALDAGAAAAIPLVGTNAVRFVIQ